MSLEARQALVDSPNTIFQRDSQRSDLLDVNLTQTGLIALLGDLVAKGHILLFTSIKSDHHDDSGLGEHCHFNGYCADVWVNHTADPTDYLDASELGPFLKDVDADSWMYQIGLAGTAWTSANALAAGDSVFHDDGADHIHLGAR